jgi:hypothetical protein
MARTGRPPKPAEVKRRTGNPGKRALPEPSTVVALRPADGVPPSPAELLTDGAALWAKVWTAGAVWIAPSTDMEAVAEVCRLTDDAAIARERYRATRDPGDLRALTAVSKLLQEALAAIGFNPTARSRLGVAEVKAQTKLEELRARSAKRTAASS